MPDYTPFPVELITPVGVAFSGDAQMLVVPGAAGELGILAHHAPLVSLLDPGVVRVTDEGGAVRRFAADDGFLQVRQNRALVLGVDPASGQTTVVREQTDPAWVDVVPGTPAWTAEAAIRGAQGVAVHRRDFGRRLGLARDHRCGGDAAPGVGQRDDFRGGRVKIGKDAFASFLDTDHENVPLWLSASWSSAKECEVVQGLALVTTARISSPSPAQAGCHPSWRADRLPPRGS